MQPPIGFDFINRANADYIDQMHQRYQRDPRSVPDAWQAFFAGFEIGSARSEAASGGRAPGSVNGSAASASANGTAAATNGRFSAADEAGASGDKIPLTMGVYDMVHTFRELGHFIAHLDPLGHDRGDHPLLRLDNFGMSEADLNRQVGQGSFLGKTDGTLRDLVAKLRETYCGTIGVEYIGISDKAQRDWLQERMEPILNRPSFNAAETRALMFQLVAAEEFEQFLARTQSPGTKRFGLEGGESFIPLVNAIIEQGATLGGEQFIMSMAHRGRLNALAHIFNKPYETLLSEFAGTSRPMVDVSGDGDVKYHLGYANERPVNSSQGALKVKVSLLPNPSHLELINPVAQGITRAKQNIFGDKGRSRVVPICVHGDAAFTGQGVVAETLNLSELAGFATGGTIHIIINNQIGFTTPPRQGRFTPYPTDVAKAIQAPIFHVNGDDPEAVIWAARLAIEFRQRFKCDVMIDLWCYRRNGHNEQDEPTFTQPVMYREIAQHPSVRTLYARQLLEQKRIGQAELDAMKTRVLDRLNIAKDLAKETKPREKVPSFKGAWSGFGRAGLDWTAKTQVSKDVLKRVAASQQRVPAGFTVNPKLQRLVLDKRVEMVNTGKNIDWGCAEMLAFGTLLLEGHNVRLTGQDVERGTFSHRHAVLFDFQNGEPYYPLAHITDEAGANQGQFTIINSMLSEFAVLGFEWGYASADPRNLVMWEAQFGDFVNGAQPIIDQILVSAESKWRYANGLVMLLPHGYEGQGPEHSNAYVERFLSMCAEENIQVAIPSTPAQYFHILRRQIHRKFRKPLVLMMPKGLLKKDGALSDLPEFTEGSFQNVIDDPALATADRDKVRRVLVCTGKVYFMLRDALRAAERDGDIAIVRVEQLYPFPENELRDVLAKYPRKEDVCWVQEEPQNRGAWSFMQPRLRTMLPDTLVNYIGRDAAASPATGSQKQHLQEERELVATALDLPSTKRAAAAAAAATPASSATSATAAASASAEVRNPKSEIRIKSE
jgi:2-oxoglutarate dehydrogenase E1 component